MKFDQGGYTITLDDQRDNPIIIERSTKVKTLWFAELDQLLEAEVNEEGLYAFFIDVNLSGPRLGLEAIAPLKKKFPYVPIFVVTSNDRPEIVQESFSLGADDFIRKPLVPQEINARFKRRIDDLAQKASQNVIEFGDLTIDLMTSSIRGPQKALTISPTEIRILACIATNRGLLVDTNTLINRAWGVQKVNKGAFNRKMHAVRQVLEMVTNRVLIKTVHGKGVKMVDSLLEEEAS